MAVFPVESAECEILGVQRGQAPVEPVQIAHPGPQHVVNRKAEQFPVQGLVVIPLVPLTELRTHEQQLLAGQTVHVKPPVSRIQTWFIRKMMLKIELQASMPKVRDYLLRVQAGLC